MKQYAIVFATVFLAELGDKTQLATLSMAAGGRSRMSVFLGSALALVCTSAIAAIAGEGVARIASPLLLRRLAGVAFLALGLLFLFRSGE
jgi:putative Ca2+/H+ antiporter (TMEM165/GDT1 family)